MRRPATSRAGAGRRSARLLPGLGHHLGASEGPLPPGRPSGTANYANPSNGALAMAAELLTSMGARDRGLDRGNPREQHRSMHKITVQYFDPADGDDFEAAYRERHVPLVQAVPGLERFTISLPH